MMYADSLEQANFVRVERDDRLLDVFPKENREKGVELWERWDKDMVELVRVRLPYVEKRQPQHFVILRTEIEEALNQNLTIKLS